LFRSSIIYLFLCVEHVVLSLYLVLSSRIVLVVLDIRATNYFASLFINICSFNNTFSTNNREINTNKTIIYSREIILLVIKEDVLAFKSCFSFLLCLIFYNLLITNKRIKSFNKIENLKTFNNISNASLVSKTYINYLMFTFYV
jgi:hypothetical protein